jgi:hypothetical protein
MAKGTQTAYQIIDIPRIAAEQVNHFVSEFQEYFDPNAKEGLALERFRDMLPILMRLLGELRISTKVHKLAFIPPGTPFDPSLMQANEPGGEVYRFRDAEISTLRVKISFWPALIALKEEFPEAETHGQDYRKALIEFRDWYPAPGEQEVWNVKGAIQVGRAVVVVEKDPDLESDSDLEAESNS